LHLLLQCGHTLRVRGRLLHLGSHLAHRPPALDGIADTLDQASLAVIDNLKCLRRIKAWSAASLRLRIFHHLKGLGGIKCH
jgi:hypothetical protein